MGIVHGFDKKKFEIFPSSYFWQNQKGKCVWQYSRKKKKLLYTSYKKQKVKKSKNWHFSKGVTPWFWSKIWKISTFFIIGKIKQENVFEDILGRKKSFLRL